MTNTPRTARRRVPLLLAGIGAAVLSMAMLPLAGSGASPSYVGNAVALGGTQDGTPQGAAGPDGLGIHPGKIKHVWLIILENKSFDATFTGLNNNTYLWKTLPAQGVLLKNYYGTGHFSQDNYVSLVSGQATEPDHQADCPQYKDAVGSVITNPADPNYGQWASAAG